MSPRMLRGIALLLLAVASAGRVAPAFASAPAEGRPNLLIIAIDTLRADHLGCYGHEAATSPTLDALAATGLRFENARAMAPWTLPSFASAFTGLAPSRHGAGLSGPIRDLGSDIPQVLSTAAKTLAEILQAAGYRTAAVASNPYLSLGLQRGYGEFLNRPRSASVITALARQWLATTSKEEPWHLLVHFNDPHEPTDVHDVQLKTLGHGRDIRRHPEREALERWGAGEGSLGRLEFPLKDEDQIRLRVKEALYDGAIRQVDECIALLLSDLEARSEREETLIVVFSDHGEEFLEHAELERDAAQDPRGIWGIGHGQSHFDELLRVPLILVGPGLGPTVIERSMSLVDLTPTLLGMLDLEVPKDLDGVDRRDWLGQPSHLREASPVYAENIAYGPDLVMQLAGSLKIIADRTGQPLWIFDLAVDPLEQNPLALDDPRSVPARAQLDAELERLLRLRPPPPDPALLSEEMREGLRSLGYVQ